jgi:hypothetical protein
LNVLRKHQDELLKQVFLEIVYHIISNKLLIISTAYQVEMRLPGNRHNDVHTDLQILHSNYP